MCLTRSLNTPYVIIKHEQQRYERIKLSESMLGNIGLYNHCCTYFLCSNLINYY